MNTGKLIVSLLVFVSMAATTLSTQKSRRKPAGDPELAKKIGRFSPTVLTADVSQLTPGDRQALAKILAATKLMDPLFLRQVWRVRWLKQNSTPTKCRWTARLNYF